jgi:hypothetical protein
LQIPAHLPVETWTIRDPFGGPEEDFRRARGEIEMKVMNLILRVRTRKLDVGRGKTRSALTRGR